MKMVKIKPLSNLEKIVKKSGRSRAWPLYWNLIGEAEDQEAIYYFLIYNTNKRELENITGLIYKNSPLPIEITRMISGKYKDVYYRLLIENAHNKIIEISRLAEDYNGKLKKDPNLYEGKSPDRIENYPVIKLQKKIG